MCVQTLRIAQWHIAVQARGPQKALRFESPLPGCTLVLIRWLHSGQRLEETVPLAQARHRRNELEAQGATVYWSERLVQAAIG